MVTTADYCRITLIQDHIITTITRASDRVPPPQDRLQKNATRASDRVPPPQDRLQKNARLVTLKSASDRAVPPPQDRLQKNARLATLKSARIILCTIASTPRLLREWDELLYAVLEINMSCVGTRNTPHSSTLTVGENSTVVILDECGWRGEEGGGREGGKSLALIAEFIHLSYVSLIKSLAP